MTAQAPEIDIRGQGRAPFLYMLAHTGSDGVMESDLKPMQPPQTAHRYDGVAKVTGKAKYAAEFSAPFSKSDLLYAYMVQSTIACGSVTAIDCKAAERARGVVAVLTPFNAPKLPVSKTPSAGGRKLSLLQDTTVAYNGQPVALVIAKSLPQAIYAARLLNVTYEEAPAKLDFLGRLSEAHAPKAPVREPASKVRGDVDAAVSRAVVVVENTYTTPIQNHNPMEPHATIAWWEGEKLEVYDSTQFVMGVKVTLARSLNVLPENVHVRSPYVGGAFGCKGQPWSHVVLAAMAAKIVQRPVKLVLERGQMFGPVGARATTVNKIKLAAASDGKVALVQHDVIMHASVLEEFGEHAQMPARMLYASDAHSSSISMVDVNYGQATNMRAPGFSSGTAVLEIAMDELAEKLNMDPVQLRLVNYAERDMNENKPWTSKHLRECYTQAANRFGWSKRNPGPRQRREGNKLIGHGMATAVYKAHRSAASAQAKYLLDGHVFVGSATHDLGTGMYTVMAQTAAANLGLDPMQIEVKLGDSSLPRAPVAGGSQSTASVGPAVDAACTALKQKVVAAAVSDKDSPVFGAKDADVEVAGGRVFLRSAPSKGEAVTALLARNGNRPIEAEGSAAPEEERSPMSSYSFGAVFAEVAVDNTTNMVEVRRVVATYDIGTLVNNKTGISQLQGGIVWGVSFALHEEARIDLHYGRTVNENLAEYHVPVNADIRVLDVTVLNIPDTKFSPLGARGIGEIGITGSAAAVANAIYNATGKRVREYPITPDKIMRG